MHYSRNDSVVYLVSQLAKSFSKTLSIRTVPLGFSPGQFPILLELWQQDNQTQKALLDKLDIEQATLANTLRRMERDKLINRVTHPKDKRSQIVSLTQLGRNLEKDAIAISVATENSLLTDFRKFEYLLMIEYMKRVIKSAQIQKS